MCSCNSEVFSLMLRFDAGFTEVVNLNVKPKPAPTSTYLKVRQVIDRQIDMVILIFKETGIYVQTQEPGKGTGTGSQVHEEEAR